MLVQNLLKKSKGIKITFKFKSFHNYNFQPIIGKILKKITQLDLTSSGFVSLPTKIERFTVIRSPHVDNKSREQFEIKTFNKYLDITMNSTKLSDKQKINLIINFIKNSASGLHLTIKFIT